MSMLSIERLSVGTIDKPLFTLEKQGFDKASFWGIVGANGAGKSSFLKAISGDHAYKGEIRFHDIELQEWDSVERARHIGVLPQSSSLTFSFKAQEVVSLGLTPLSLNHHESKKLVRACMQRCDCEHLADAEYPLLSGGEQQRVNLARVLVQISHAERTPLLLLDEALSAQDLGHQHQLLQLIKSLCIEQEMLILAVLHDLNHALKYCDNTMIIHHGQIHSTGFPTQVIDEKALKTCWNYEAEFLSNRQGRAVVV
ncbi:MULTISPECIES: ATP-binding cassette domain-containing protein [unclassified Oleiphilus]|jgi:iron complex transport system ATP-binding protein|uniref:ATP-binding cassette domain-containing protein n=1 Tax=unclassified Oleiphilus TaxID=2631174 RepID=UPI00083910EA|nr:MULTISPECIES: ATP-binding cassette domain-containing protein [unclassified Oleiphilus]